MPEYFAELKNAIDVNKGYDIEKIERAYALARSAHFEQKRATGEPYIIHPVAVAKILAQFGMDNETVIAGLLHDSIEDTGYTREQLAEDFQNWMNEDRII